MKISLFIFILFAFVSSLSAQNSSSQSVDDGYKGLAWGTTLDEFKAVMSGTDFQDESGSDDYAGINNYFFDYFGKSIKEGADFSDGIYDPSFENWYTYTCKDSQISYCFEQGKLFLVVVYIDTKYYDEVLSKLKKTYTLVSKHKGSMLASGTEVDKVYWPYTVMKFIKNSKCAFLFKAYDAPISDFGTWSSGVVYTSKNILSTLGEEMKKNHFDNLRKKQDEKIEDKNKNLNGID